MALDLEGAGGARAQALGGVPGEQALRGVGVAGLSGHDSTEGEQALRGGGVENAIQRMPQSQLIPGHSYMPHKYYPLVPHLEDAERIP